MQNAEFKVKIPAKINLRLAITGRRGALHTLDMIVCPYERLCDEVEFIPTKKSESGITAVDIKYAYAGFKPARFKEFYLPKVNVIANELGVGGRIAIKKNIPLGAGLGGSSACVVGALKAMLAYKESIGQTTALDDGFLLSLGSDVPCMLKGGLCRVRGVGEIVEKLGERLNCELTVRIAKGGSLSGECYALYDRLEQSEKLGRAPIEHGETDEDRPLYDMITECRNDLTLPAVTLNPRIGKLIDKMKKRFSYVVMSGSGSAVVGFGAVKK